MQSFKANRKMYFNGMNGPIQLGTNTNMLSLDEEEPNGSEDSDSFAEQIQLIPDECNNNNHNNISNIMKVKLSKTFPKKHKRGVFHFIWRTKKIRNLFFFAVLVSAFILLVQYSTGYSSISSRHKEHPDWGYNTSRHLRDYIFPDNDTTLIEPKDICDSKVFLMIVVCSSVKNFASRQIIRETWGNLTEFNYSMFPKLHEHLKGQYLLPTKTRIQFYKNHFISEDDKNKRKNNATVSTDPNYPSNSKKEKNANVYNRIKPNIKILFLIGRNKDESLMGNETLTRIHNEAMQYNDIIQENFIDTYNNLTIKTIFTLKWFKKTCLKQVAFLMKCDDDTFVNIPNLIHYLLGGTVPLYNDTFHFYDTNTFQPLASKNRLNATENYLAGHLFCTSKPISDVNNKWYTPDYIFPNDTFPMYLSGAGYIMTSDVVQRLYETALNTTFIHLEDVYLTGIIADKAGIKPQHHPLFDYTSSRKWCSFKGIFTQHELKDDSLFEAYYFVTNTTNHCAPPGKYFKKMRLKKPHAC